MSCEHLHWQVQVENRVGYGTCLDCDEEIPLPVLFNDLKARMESDNERFLNILEATVRLVRQNQEIIEMLLKPRITIDNAKDGKWTGNMPAK